MNTFQFLIKICEQRIKFYYTIYKAYYTVPVLPVFVQLAYFLEITRGKVGSPRKTSHERTMETAGANY